MSMRGCGALDQCGLCRLLAVGLASIMWQVLVVGIMAAAMTVAVDPVVGVDVVVPVDSVDGVVGVVSVPDEGRHAMWLGFLFCVSGLAVVHILHVLLISFPHHLPPTRYPTIPDEEFPIPKAFRPRRQTFLATWQGAIAPPAPLAAVVASFGGKIEVVGGAHWVDAMRDVSTTDCNQMLRIPSTLSLWGMDCGDGRPKRSVARTTD